MWRRMRVAALAAGVVITLTGAVWWPLQGNAERVGSGGSGRNAAIGAPFTLTDQNGRAVTEKDYQGKLMLVFFGYTFCPDVCPTALGDVALALDALGADARAVKPLFITIDPERDTAAILAAYVPLFHESLVGLTGTSEQIAQTTQAYRVFYRKVADPQYSYYLMDHTSFVYLMGRDGKFLSMFAYGTAPEEMAAVIRSNI